MRKLLLILGLAILASAQTSSRRVPPDEVHTQARQQSDDGSTMHFKGDVKIATQGMVLTCDEADYNKETREIEARGNVKVKLTLQP